MPIPDLRWLENLLTAQGNRRYTGPHEESVTALEHALQCAQLAEWAHAPEPLVAAALLHDVGHLLVEDDPSGKRNDVHELLGCRLLERETPPEVTEPIRLHVAAKRYLCAVETGYHDLLSPASRHTLLLQGGPMSNDEAHAFARDRHGQAAVSLRRWDDLAKVSGRPTPPLAHYMQIVRRVARAR
ncbi:MAG: HD domain-containing protein [Burkholderiaceae bacterium]|nr:HD domain-containing protein [Burkholderiaceae bacterium]